jgi:quercetin dioxygenase-like cupin family protein
MSNLIDLANLPMLEVWGESVRARRLEGERISLAIVELGPNAVVREHQHEAEQLGLCISGSIMFTIDGETRELGPGGTWRILSGRPHDAVAGPGGAIVIDVFNPVRSDWDALPLVDPPTPPRWPTA